MRHSALLPLLVLGLAAAGCGGDRTSPSPPSLSDSDPPSAPRVELAARAAAAKDLVAVDRYALTRTGSEEEVTVLVVRAEDGDWRVDIPGGALGGTADVSIIGTGDGLLQCRLPSTAQPDPGCVRVETLTPDIDPQVQSVFTDWLDVFTDRAAPVAVTRAEPAGDVPGDCYSVATTAASLQVPVDPGIYCYSADGTLTGAEVSFGTLRHTSTSESIPPSVDLPGPVVDQGEPLPTASPPPPSPTAGPDPTGTPAPDPSP